MSKQPNEIGESVTSMNRRGDIDTWPRVYNQMKQGARLQWNSLTKRFYTVGVDNCGIGMNSAGVNRLLKSGKIIELCLNQFILNPEYVPEKDVFDMPILTID